MSSNPYRKDFPLLENNKVIYLDNAATSQRPEAVIQAEAQFYEKYNANPLRGLYELSVEATAHQGHGSHLREGFLPDDRESPVRA